MGRLQNLRYALYEMRVAYELANMEDPWESMLHGSSARDFIGVYLTTDINYDKKSRKSNNDVYPLDKEDIII